jgi:hypothetical protein
MTMTTEDVHELAQDIAAELGDPSLAERIVVYEALRADLEERREKLSKRWARKIKPVARQIAKGFDAKAYVAQVQRHVTRPNDDDMTGDRAATIRRDAAKALALGALTRWLHDNPETAQEWTELVSLAEAEAAAEGVVQATALLQDAGVTPADVTIDLDKLFDDTLANLRELDTYGAEAGTWIADELGGLAGDVGKCIADAIARDFGQEEMANAVNAIIDKGAGVQAYIDESIHSAMQQAQIAQMAAAGVDSFDFVTQPDACEECAPLDSSIAGAYSLADLPEPPLHFSCRCSTAPAGTVSL